jgi:hypothetical protein|tara:strand:+ start:31 stop:273 length:243 start_codon:yes stop_codon:yes gene_type:complete
MLKPKVKKLTSKELKELTDLQNGVNDLLMNIGNAELVKNQLIGEHIKLQAEWRVMTGNLEEKYGSVSINLEDGLLSPNKE